MGFLLLNSFRYEHAVAMGILCLPLCMRRCALPRFAFSWPYVYSLVAHGAVGRLTKGPAVYKKNQRGEN